MTDSLEASTESNQGGEVTPNQKKQETVEDRLRRLTKEAIGGGGHSQFGPMHGNQGGPNIPNQESVGGFKQHQGHPFGPRVPQGQPGGLPGGVLHKIMQEHVGKPRI